MTSTQNGSRGRSLEICHVFSDFTAFEQQFYCSFLWIGGGVSHDWSFFCGCLTPFRSLNERSYIRFIYNYSSFVNSQPPCQILCDDSVYICKSCHSRVQKNFTCSFVPFYTSVQKKVLVMQLLTYQSVFQQLHRHMHRYDITSILLNYLPLF